MFLIPKVVIRRVEAICRNYFWDGSPDYHRVPLVSWDRVTMPKDAGGLGVKKVENWNWAAVDSPWTWKNVCKVKDKLKDGFGENCWLPDENGYRLKNGYKWLCIQQPKVDWCSLVWNSWNIPKHSIITWLIIQEGLNTKAKLFQSGFCEDTLCLICGEQPETITHLFYECHYSCRIKAALAVWMGRVFPTLADLQNGRTGSLQWKAMAMIFNVYLYTIWHQRNIARLHQFVVRPELLAAQIEEIAGRRGCSKAGPAMSNNTNGWLSCMQ
ncbi:uncharacterized protein LOC141658052 [Silene latifolia]|uniref:uncharacterized protein LOC141658052 n=1 Tax=Silene latifolia TaxID=37657 RepID=UPI003D789146